MTTSNIRRASLDTIRRMKQSGEIAAPTEPAEAEELGPEFWAKAKVEEPKAKRSVRLDLDPDVFYYFKSRGRHITRMQEVLKAYVRAHEGAER